jgi:hypothetical protein
VIREEELMGEIRTAKDMVAQAKARTENWTPEQVAAEVQRRKGAAG